MSTRAALIVVAGGSAQRFGGDGNKVYAELAGRPVLSYALEASRVGNELVGPVVVVAREDEIQTARAVAGATGSDPRFRIVGGGVTRQDSELFGLEALADDIGEERINIVAIHDAARPFLTHQMLNTIVETAARRGGAIPGLEPTDAMWAVRHGMRPEPLPKDSLRAVQTPQAFHAPRLLTAYRAAAADGFIGPDTAATVYRYSDLEIEIVPGDPRNIKITHSEDLERAGQLATEWSEADWLTSPAAP